MPPVLGALPPVPDRSLAHGLHRIAAVLVWPTIAWNPNGRAELPNPPGRRIARRQDLAGTEQPVRPGTPAIEIGPARQLLEFAP